MFERRIEQSCKVGLHKDLKVVSEGLKAKGDFSFGELVEHANKNYRDKNDLD